MFEKFYKFAGIEGKDAIEDPENHLPKHITVPGVLVEGETVK